MPYRRPDKCRLRQNALAFLLTLLACTAIASAAPAPPPPAPANPRTLTLTVLNHPIDLAEAFLVQPGDDSAYASPTFDDSAWPTLPRQQSLASIGIRDHDFVWYRLHLRIPPHSHNLAFLLVNFTGSQQIFVNGTLTGPSRSFQGGGYTFPNFDSTATIPDRLIDSGNLVIAIRAGIHNSRHSLAAQPGFSARSHLFIAEASVVENKLTLDSFFNYTSNLTDILFTCFTLLITLTLWLALRKEREYLYLAVYLAGAVYSEVFSVLSSRYDTRVSRTSVVLVTLINVFSLLGGLEFARIVLKLPRRRWFVAYESTIAALTLLSGAIDLYTFSSGAPPLPILWVMLSLYSVAAGSLGLGLPIFALYIWRKTRNFDALLLSVPVLARGLVFYLYIGYDVFAIFRYGAVRSLPNPPIGRFGVSWSEITDFIFLLALLVFLILRTLRLARARAALAAEIAAAQSVQQLLLARSTQPTPGFSVETAYHPASEVGGDFFLIAPAHPLGSPSQAKSEAGIHEPTPEGLLVIVGDVSGKGLSAAMRVAMILGVLRRETSRDPATILTNLNHALLTDHSSNHPASTATQPATQPGFTTACCLHLTPSGHYTFANAGHISPYLCTQAQAAPPTASPAQELLAPPALPLGLAPDQPYLTETGRLMPGQRLVLLSDGIPEARNAKGTLYGFDRLPHLLTQPAAEIANTARTYGQEDDITVLTITLS